MKKNSFLLRDKYTIIFSSKTYKKPNKIAISEELKSKCAISFSLLSLPPT